ncbi:hypothetical protein EV421DRAFT_1913592 [Armillaria borealis]|uniref:Uncharacterized protein n=1 Tax=Armillaria borealis TaxID=47425 RepID=A0AA39IUA2_9AGAR|nr:hypothetical protein EV421DRAFT_1913592 [Armillaria borealis]
MPPDSNAVTDPLIIDGKRKRKESEHAHLGGEQPDDSSSTILLPSSIRQATKKVRHMVKKAGTALVKAGTVAKNLTQCKKTSKSVTSSGPEINDPASAPHADADNDSLPPLQPFQDDEDDDTTQLATENSKNSDGHEDMDAAPGADTSEATEEARLEKLVKLWKAPVYAFFASVPDIAYDDDNYTADAGSTGALRRHIRKCWGDDILAATDATKDLTKSRKIIDKELGKRKPKNGSIVSMLKRFGSKVISYSTCVHTKTEVRAECMRWCAESLRPFNLFADRGFKSLMKMGQPQHYIPHPMTVSCNTKTVFT